jgi:V/A-type H+-transporting ATPase subunit I
MAGVSFVGPSEEIERIALSLLKTENFEPMSPEVMMGGQPLNSRFQTFKANPYDALLAKLDRFWAVAGVPAPEQPAADIPLVPFEDLEKRADALLRLVDEWAGLKVEELQAEHEKWNAVLKLGDALRETGRSFSDLSHFLYGRMSIGTLTRENWRRFSETSLAAPILAMPLIEDAGRVTVVVFCGDDYGEDLDKIFSSVHLRPISLQPEEFPRYDSADSVRYAMEGVEAEIERCRAMPARYAADKRVELENLYGAVYARQRVYSLCQLRGEMFGVMILSGWIPEKNLGAARAMVREKAPHTLTIAEDGEVFEREGREIPTLLHNLPLVRRFQEIVRLYSLPSYSELDPTFVVAVSFCFFFGFMFGDVGHGAALILGTLLLERKKIMGRSIASVIQVAGVFSVLFGFLYGSVFGNEELLHPIWLSPMKDVNTILPVSIGVGIAFLTVGIGFKIRNSARKREWGEVFFSPEGWAGLVFYWLAVAQAYLVTSGSPLALGGGVFGAAMTALLVLMIFGNGVTKVLFHGETVDEGGVVHVFSVFHAMLNFVSNTASFVRLAAFALNHAGLCGAVVMLGQMVDHAPGGKVLHALILVVGHLVIVGLEGMIVFIQTLRLEYYEFFGKFYSGGGREFSPVLWRRRNRR